MYPNESFLQVAVIATATTVRTVAPTILKSNRISETGTGDQFCWCRRQSLPRQLQASIVFRTVLSVLDSWIKRWRRSYGSICILLSPQKSVNFAAYTTKYYKKALSKICCVWPWNRSELSSTESCGLVYAVLWTVDSIWEVQFKNFGRAYAWSAYGISVSGIWAVTRCSHITQCQTQKIQVAFGWACS